MKGAGRGDNARPAAGLVERVLEQVIFSSRWILAPFYLGLVVALLIVLFKFIVELWHLCERFPAMSETDIILAVLSLIDISFLANLILIVVFSGYENFVSRLEVESHDRPEWMTTIDFSGLKQKLLTSIVAISAIQVLKSFMNIEQYDSVKLAWVVGIHLVFVTSMLMLALSDRLGEGVKSTEHLDSKATRKAARSG
jgi:uncharacterized protein (TIGR00645 family)